MSFFLAVFAIALPAAPAEDPPYPYEIPEWYEALAEKLREPMDFAIPQPVPLESALRILERAGGVRIRVAEGDEKPARSEVELQVSDLPLEFTLRDRAKINCAITDRAERGP